MSRRIDLLRQNEFACRRDPKAILLSAMNEHRFATTLEKFVHPIPKRAL